MTLGGPFGARVQLKNPVHFNSVLLWIYFSRSLKIEQEKYLKYIRKKDIWGPRPEDIDI